MPALAIEPNTSELLTPTADTLVASSGDHTRLAHVVAVLPQRERIVLELFYVEQLTVIEVAAVLDLEIRDVLLHHAGAMALIREAIA